MAPRRLSGPVQRGAIQVLRDMGVASTSDIMARTHSRLGNVQHASRSARRVLDEIATRVGRAEGIGRPADGSIQNDSGLPQGPAGASGAS
jgi:hypothetical protein